MNAPAPSSSIATDDAVWNGASGAGVAIAVGLLALGFIFQREIVAAVTTWDQSTAYNHCYLIIPIVLYMLWDRREMLRPLWARPVPWIALLGLPMAFFWLIAERLGIMEGRQLMAVTLAELLFLSVLGWRLFRAASGPLLYLYFLVPFGEFLVPRLQDITSVFIRYGVRIIGIPAYIDGYTIEIPEGTFYVAEACAGLRFLIASIAFGVLYALLMYRSPVRRAAFMAVSVIVPIIANGFRALGIVVAGHWLGSAQAAAADHVVYGWIFFSIVILLLTAIGLPFREDLTRETPPEDLDPVDLFATRKAAIATALTVAIAAASPGIALALDRFVADDAPPPRLSEIGLDCALSVPLAPEGNTTPGRLLSLRATCPAGDYDIAVETFSPRSTAGPVFAERRRLSRVASAEEVSESRLDGPGTATWRLVKSTQPNRLTLAGLWIDGEPAAPGLATRLRLAKASLLGSSFVPVVMVITPVVDWSRLSPEMGRRLEQHLGAFIGERPALDEQMRALSRAK